MFRVSCSALRLVVLNILSLGWLNRFRSLLLQTDLNALFFETVENVLIVILLLERVLDKSLPNVSINIVWF